MTRSNYIVLGSLLLILVILAAATYTFRERRLAEERNVAKDVLFSEEATEAYTDIEGREIDLVSAEGKVLVVTSWASWCPQCAAELELLNALAVERNDDRLQVLAMNRMEPKEQAQRFISTLPELPRISYVLDSKDYFFDSVVGYAMPETIFYNSAGEIVLHKRGSLTAEEAKAALDLAYQEEGQ